MRHSLYVFNGNLAPPLFLRPLSPNHSFSHTCRQGKKLYSQLFLLVGTYLRGSLFEHHAIILGCQPPGQAVTLYRLPKLCPLFFTDFTQFLSIIHGRGVTRHLAHERRHDIGFTRSRQDFNTIFKKSSILNYVKNLSIKEFLHSAVFCIDPPVAMATP